MTVTTLGAFPGANDKDKKERIPAAIAALNRALAGDSSVLTYMTAQSQNSATAVGKDAFKRALAIYSANAPKPATVTTAAPNAPTPAAPTGTTQAPKPLAIPTVSAPGSTPAPIGFNPGAPLTDPVPFNNAPFGWIPGRPAPAGYHVVSAGTRSEHLEPDTPGISIHGVAPGIITPVTVGRVRPRHQKPFVAADVGGVISGPPIDDATVTTAAPAPVVAAPSTNLVSSAASPAAATGSDTGGGSKNLLIAGVLIAGTLLFFFVDHHRGRK